MSTNDFPSHPLIRVCVALLCLMLVVPIVLVLILSFGGDDLMKFPPTSLSLRWFAQFFGDPGWQRALWRSVAVAAMSCALSTVVGLLAAYALVRGKARGKKFLLSLVLLPLIIPTIIGAISLYFVSGPLGLIGSRVWLSVCHATIALPIVVVILLSALQNVDINLERAAFGLGAGRLETFWRVVIPLAMPGIVSAALFSFLSSFDEVILALFLSGLNAETLPVRIWNSLQMNMDSTVAAVSSFLIFVTILILVLERAARAFRQAEMRRERA